MGVCVCGGGLIERDQDITKSRTQQRVRNNGLASYGRRKSPISWISGIFLQISNFPIRIYWIEEKVFLKVLIMGRAHLKLKTHFFSRYSLTRSLHSQKYKIIRLLQGLKSREMSYSILSLACENTRFSSLFAAGDVWRGGKKEGSFLQFPPVLFSCLRFLNSGDPTISEPGTG